MDKNFREVIIDKYSWKCYLFGTDKLILKTNKPPMLFWRWMQFLFFGNRWTKEANSE